MYMYSRGQKNGDVSVPYRPVCTAFPTISVPVQFRLLAVRGASPRAHYCSVPFRSTIRSGRVVCLTLKPRLHFTILGVQFEIDYFSPAFVVILVALARILGVRDQLLFTSVRRDLGDSRPNSRLFEIDYFSPVFVVILVTLARLRS